MSHVIKIDNISKSYDHQTILNDVCWQIQPGDVVGLLGKNGAGKSTLIEALLGLNPVDNGTVRLFGQVHNQLDKATRARIGYVPQQCAEVSWMTVEETLAFRAQCYPFWDHEKQNALCAEWGLNPSKKVGDLSVGQAQKLMLILALCHNPDLLVLDEPAASLDPAARRELMEQIIELTASEDKAVIFSTHITSDLERIANKVAILHKGSLQYFLPLDELKENTVKLVIERQNNSKIEVPHCVKQWQDGNELVCLVDQLSPDWLDTVRATGAQVEVVGLSLEDIFVELTQ